MRVFLRLLCALLLTGLLSTGAAASEIEVQPVRSLGVEVDFSIDLTGADLCILELLLEEEADQRFGHRTFGVDHRYFFEPDDNIGSSPVIKPQPFEKFYVRNLSAANRLSGVKRLHSDELPRVPTIWLQLFVKGFECKAYADHGKGLDLEDVDLVARAPKTVTKDALIEITSQVLQLTLP